MGKLSGMIGQKLFKENADKSISLIRIKDVNQQETVVSFIDLATKEVKTTKSIEDLRGYTPLIPDGVLTFNIVKNIYGQREDDVMYDVVITGAKYFSIQIKDPTPFCICRQCANDIFAQLSGRTQQYAGIAISQTDCPKGVNFMDFLDCDEIIYTKIISIYRGDTINYAINNLIDHEPFDSILKTNYHIHSVKEGKPKLDFMKKHKGWCTTMELLVNDNNFQLNLDEMLDVLAVDFNLSEYIVEKTLPNSEETYDSISDELKLWLSKTLQVMLGDVTVLKYGEDIDVTEFNNSRYTFIRDNTSTTYMVIYTLDGEHHISDLIEQDISKNFHVPIYNKYNVKVNK